MMIDETPRLAPASSQRAARRQGQGVRLRPLVYLTKGDAEARYWRFKDLFDVLPLDRERLQIFAYEGATGELRRFIFQLKADLPEAFVRALWDRVNPPAPRSTTRP